MGKRTSRPPGPLYIFMQYTIYIYFNLFAQLFIYYLIGLYKYLKKAMVTNVCVEASLFSNLP